MAAPSNTSSEPLVYAPVIFIQGDMLQICCLLLCLKFNKICLWITGSEKYTTTYNCNFDEKVHYSSANFKILAKEMFIDGSKSLQPSIFTKYIYLIFFNLTLKYCVQVWAPKHKTDLNTLELVQKRSWKGLDHILHT